MALLVHAAIEKQIRPAARCLVGRAPHCHLVLDHSDVSREHAVVFFEGCWKVRDLSSRNGTTVAGERVRDCAALREGCTVRFGSEENTWRVLDLGPPQARAVSANGEIIEIGQSGLFLSNIAGDEVYVSSQQGAWVVERLGEIRNAVDGETVRLADSAWRLELTLGDHATLAPTRAVESTMTRLEFCPSPNEEHVELTAHIGEQRHVVSYRSHVYLLLLLARARLSDQKHDQMPVSEHGWVETKELADKLRTTSEQINVWIWRARQQLRVVSPDLAQRIVERRPTLGQLRIGYDSLNVHST